VGRGSLFSPDNKMSATSPRQGEPVDARLAAVMPPNVFLGTTNSCMLLNILDLHGQIDPH